MSAKTRVTNRTTMMKLVSMTKLILMMTTTTTTMPVSLTVSFPLMTTTTTTCDINQLEYGHFGMSVRLGILAQRFELLSSSRNGRGNCYLLVYTVEIEFTGLHEEILE